MAVVQSLGAVQRTGATAAWYPAMPYGLTLYADVVLDYAAIYRTQPNVRTVVSFLARNIAQLGLKAYERVSDTERRHIGDHPLERSLRRPNPFTTRYRLMDDLVHDIGIYGNAYWLKVRGNGDRLWLVRLPAREVRPVGSNLLTLDGYELLSRPGARFAPDEVVHFRLHNPDDARIGLSPLETLRRTIAEDLASGDHREWLWRNHARPGVIIERPLDAPEWSDHARKRFREEFEALHAGAQAAGRTAILEDGMTAKELSITPRDAQYLEGRKLSREEVAAAFHVPLPMVGILEHATYSNITEQHKQLYQDTLAPWLVMVEEEVQLQLLHDFGVDDGVYVEFNLAEKLKGSFEEQSAALQSSVGRPWMTADEARALINLPAIGGDASKLVTPLNVLVSDPDESDPERTAGDVAALTVQDPDAKARTKALDATLDLRERHVEKWREVLTAFFGRQAAVVLKALRAGAVAWDAHRWDRELGQDLHALNAATALVFARRLAAELGVELDEDRMQPWLAEHSRVQAENLNRRTAEAIEMATDSAAVETLFAASRALQVATSGVTAAANFGAHDAAAQAGQRTKTWRVNSNNPRSAHAALNGTTVGIDERFPNGMRWPGDPAGGADDLANCRCSVTFS